MKTIYKSISVVLLLLIVSLSTTLKGQPFTNVFSSTNIPPGGVVSVFDYDNDGKEDWIYEKTGDTTYTLLKNNGMGLFTDVTITSNLPKINPATFYNNTNDPTVIPVDIDNDYDYDLFYWESFNNQLRLHLWENKNGVFNEVSQCIGWDTPLLIGNLYSDGMKAFNFVDYDKDGDLDITYNDYSNNNNQTTVLLVNEINTTGQFTTKTTLISGHPSGTTTRVYPFDFDNDGDFDFLGWQIANISLATFNFHTIKLFQNNGGAFSDISSISGLVSSNYYAGFILFDFDNDGFIDILYGCTDNNMNAPPNNKFYKNNGNGTFTDITSNNDVHYSNHYNVPTAVDYDNDGDDDLSFERSGFGMNYAPFYINQSSTFVENSSSLGINVFFPGGQNFTGGRKWIDYNEDGTLDLFVCGGGSNMRLFQNNSDPDSSKFLSVKLIGCSSPADPLGARTVVWKNGVCQTRYYIYGKIASSSNNATSKILNFGLGISSTADSLIVYWPSGNVTKQYNVSANQNLTIYEDPNCTRTPSYIASSINTVNLSICPGDSALIGGVYQSNVGTYLNYFPVIGSCDSLVVTNLTLGAVPPSPGTITGPDTVCANQQNIIYTVQNSTGATSYQWSTPVGSILNSGSTTSSIDINFGNTSGYVLVSGVNNCGIGVPSTYYVTVEPCSTASVMELLGLNSLNIYPNPISDHINIEMNIARAENLEISLFDVLGKLIKTVETEYLSGPNKIIIPANDIPNGFYNLVIKTDKASIARKVIIENR